MSRGNLVRAVPAPRESPRRVWVSARRYAVAALVVWLGLPVAGCYWPRSSSVPVPQLAHPAFDAATSGLKPPFRFAVFGDQKGLAKSGEWDALLRDLRSLDPPPAFLLDTGDIVENGVHRDQFVRLEQILSVLHVQYRVVGSGLFVVGRQPHLNGAICHPLRFERLMSIDLTRHVFEAPRQRRAISPI